MPKICVNAPQIVMSGDVHINAGLAVSTKARVAHSFFPEIRTFQLLTCSNWFLEFSVVNILTHLDGHMR